MTSEATVTAGDGAPRDSSAAAALDILIVIAVSAAAYLAEYGARALGGVHVGSAAPLWRLLPLLRPRGGPGRPRILGPGVPRVTPPQLLANLRIAHFPETLQVLRRLHGASVGCEQ